MKSHNKGFASVVVIVIICLAIAAGGATYYVKKQSTVKTKIEGVATTTAQVSVGTESTGTIRSLFSMTGNLKCEVHGSNPQGEANGTVYVSGTSMRGDFTTKSGETMAIESSMIKQGDSVYFWSGENGGKVALTEAMKAEAGASSNVSLNDNVSYKCAAWSPDASKFTVPTSVKFIDISAMMKGQIKP
ncbi:MAG: hypothetical protein WC761_04605 [Candidatus Paceibacterota bacterium]|jgi:hypothetical protein